MKEINNNSANLYHDTIFNDITRVLCKFADPDHELLGEKGHNGNIYILQKYHT